MNQSNIKASENHGSRQKRRSHVELIVLFVVLGLYTTFLDFRGMNTSLVRDEDLKFGIDPNAPQSESLTENQAKANPTLDSDLVFDKMVDIPRRTVYSKEQKSNLASVM
jgi:hypothetical protein